MSNWFYLSREQSPLAINEHCWRSAFNSGSAIVPLCEWIVHSCFVWSLHSCTFWRCKSGTITYMSATIARWLITFAQRTGGAKHAIVALFSRNIALLHRAIVALLYIAHKSTIWQFQKATDDRWWAVHKHLFSGAASTKQSQIVSGPQNMWMAWPDECVIFSVSFSCRSDTLTCTTLAKKIRFRNIAPLPRPTVTPNWYSCISEPHTLSATYYRWSIFCRANFPAVELLWIVTVT